MKTIVEIYLIYFSRCLLVLLLVVFLVLLGDVLELLLVALDVLVDFEELLLDALVLVDCWLLADCAFITS
jgi:hypothetical protein